MISPLVVFAILSQGILVTIPAMAADDQPADVHPSLVIDFASAPAVSAGAVDVPTCEPLQVERVGATTRKPAAWTGGEIFLPILGSGYMCANIANGTNTIRISDGRSALVTENMLLSYRGLSVARSALPTMTSQEIMDLMRRPSAPANGTWRLVHAQSIAPTLRDAKAAQDLPPGPSRWLEWYLGEMLDYLDQAPEGVIVPVPILTPVNNLPMLAGSTSLLARCPAMAGRVATGGIYEGFFWDPVSSAWIAIVQWVDTTMLTACPWMAENIFIPGSAVTTNVPETQRRAAEAYADAEADQWDVNAWVYPDWSVGMTPEQRDVLVTTTAVGVGTVAVYVAIGASMGGGSIGGGGLYLFSSTGGVGIDSIPETH